jgi:phage terminase large subunit-like protein
MKSRKRKEPGYGVLRHEMDLMAKAPQELQRKVLEKATPESLLKWDADFEHWAHQNQLPPNDEGWRIWLMLAGRGFGKTRAGSEWIFRLANGRPGVKVGLVGATIGEARSIMVEGVSGLIAVARRYRRRLTWEPSVSRLTWPNGSEAQLFSGDNADGLRGPEFDFGWADELAKWRQAEAAWDNLQMALRRGLRARALVTTTPRPMRLLERIRDDRWSVTTTGRTSDNINLDEKFIEVMTATYGGTRIGAQELDGVLLQEAEGALWPRALLGRARAERPAHFDRIVVGVDPPASGGEKSDACGIVVCGSFDNKLYVLEDATVRSLSPEGWASRVAAAAARWDTSQVVAEANNGGTMVQSVLNAADVGLFVRLVHATRGKSARAEPVALKFETGKAFFAGRFPELEAELGGMIAGGGYEGPGRSPDRADAMVWAMTVLGETKSGLPRVRRL